MNHFIRLLYAILVAAAVVTFIGVGIFSFYQPPKAPSYPNYATNETVYQRQLDDYNKAQSTYDSKNKGYQHNITLAVLPISVIFTVVGLYLIRRSDVIGEGIALGGIALTVYGIITASIADARILRFIAVTLFLACVLVVAQRRFSPAKQPRISGI